MAYDKVSGAHFQIFPDYDHEKKRECRSVTDVLAAWGEKVASNGNRMLRDFFFRKSTDCCVICTQLGDRAILERSKETLDRRLYSFKGQVLTTYR